MLVLLPNRLPWIRSHRPPRTAPSVCAISSVQKLRGPSRQEDNRQIGDIGKEDMDLKHWASFLSHLRGEKLRIKPSDSHSLIVSTASAMRKMLPPHTKSAVTEASARRAMRVVRGLSFQSIQLEGDLASSCFLSSFEALTSPLLSSAGVPELALMADALVKMGAKPSSGWVRELVVRASNALSSFKPAFPSTKIVRVPWRALKVPLGRISKFNLPRSASHQRKMKYQASYRILFSQLTKTSLPRLISAHVSLATSASILLLRSSSAQGSNWDNSILHALPPIATQLNSMPTSHLPSLVWSISVAISQDRGMMKREATRPWVEAAATTLHQRMNSMNEPRSLSQSLHALLLLELKPYDGWLRDMERRMCDLLVSNEIESEDLSRFLWCYGQMKRKPDYTLTTRIEAHLSRLLPKMHRDEMAVIRDRLMKVFAPTIRDKKLRQTIDLMNKML